MSHIFYVFVRRDERRDTGRIYRWHPRNSFSSSFPRDTCVVTGAEKLSLDDVDEIRDTKTTNHSVAGWRTVQSQEGIVRRASLGQFDRFPVSGEPVSADGTLTPAVLRNRHTHTHTHTRVYIYRERCRPDRVIYTGNCGKNGPCTRLESCHRSERRVIWSER